MAARDESLNLRLLKLKERIIQHFGSEHWHDVGLLTNTIDEIESHPRLLRSLGFGDEDYGGHAAQVLRDIMEIDPVNLDIMEDYVDSKFGDESEYVSAFPSKPRITFAPHVFKVPEGSPLEDLVAVMMPFTGSAEVYKAIKGACEDANLECLRADDFWEDSTFMQDIFDLIFKARIVVCDFSGRNPNVMYETGLAHCLGKIVVPLTQHIGDVPSDLRHHRVLPYLKTAKDSPSCGKS